MISERPYNGQHCWAKAVSHYPLPDGLKPRTPLRVLEVIYFEVRAVDDEGREWELCTINVDAGQVAYLDDERCHESHPKFAAYYRDWLEVLRERLEAVSEFTAWRRDDIQAQISDIRWILQRNGYDPDGPLPSTAPPKATGMSKAGARGSRRLGQRDEGMGRFRVMAG